MKLEAVATQIVINYISTIYKKDFSHRFKPYLLYFFYIQSPEGRDRSMRSPAPGRPATKTNHYLHANPLLQRPATSLRQQALQKEITPRAGPYLPAPRRPSAIASSSTLFFAIVA